MKWFKFIIIVVLFCSFAYGQEISIFAGASDRTDADAPQDTVVLIDGGLDSVNSFVIEYDEWFDTPDYFEGASSLWSAVYSYTDGISVTIYIYYRLRKGEDRTGYGRWREWTLVDSLTTSEDCATRYGAGIQAGEITDLPEIADPWAKHDAIQFQYKWTPASADTAEIHAAYGVVRQKR